jgi:SAM-dependent methyltransferase
MQNIIFRKDRIVEYCRDKTVLHLGFIQHAHLYEKLIQEGNWLHNKIACVAKKLVGIDYLADEIQKIKEKYNYQCYYADVTKLGDLSLNDKFDIIVCGELIEHLENPGLMLEGVKKFMKSDALLIITTPNPWSKQRIKLIKSGILEKEWLNIEHTCWFSYQTLSQLLERKGYKKILYDYYYGDSYEKYISGRRKNLRLLKLFLLKIRNNNLKKYLQDGLFFVAGIKD